ncbi:hypothetical protein [Arthrobacter sp. UYEF3]|uniref:hypothetical protein n=1 Tax=Arthrobacter sp. UYEF3 TaxID=1756365 RepID=UPI00339995D8
MGIPAAQPAGQQSRDRVARALGQAVQRLWEQRVPFRIGQVVVGDDPFNGRREGRVQVIRSPHVGLRIPGTPAGSLVFFDHRHVRYPD